MKSLPSFGPPNLEMGASCGPKLETDPRKAWRPPHRSCFVNSLASTFEVLRNGSWECLWRGRGCSIGGPHSSLHRRDVSFLRDPKKAWLPCDFPKETTERVGTNSNKARCAPFLCYVTCRIILLPPPACATSLRHLTCVQLLLTRHMWRFLLRHQLTPP